MNPSDNTPKKKKRLSPGLVVFLIVMLVSSLMENLPRRADGVVVFALIGTLVVVAVILVIVKAAIKSSAGSASAARPVSRSAPVQSARPSRAPVKGPDAYCLVCDQTGVDHFERDKQRRLRQIDYWLSIGLIERKEYNLLRARYSRDVPHHTV